VRQRKDPRVSRIIGEWLKQEREKKHVTQETLAQISEVALSQIGKIERGVGNPTFLTILHLSRALKASPGKLLLLFDTPETGGGNQSVA
jgi:transcriptional regulator with XRE-family HTH domain